MRADFVNVGVGASFVRKYLIDKKNPKRLIWHVNAGASRLRKAYRGRRYLNYVKKRKRMVLQQSSRKGTQMRTSQPRKKEKKEKKAEAEVFLRELRRTVQPD